MADWQYLVLWACGALLGVFMSYLWLDGEEAGQAACASLFWPFFAVVLLLLTAQVLAASPFVAVYFAAKRVRKWALK